MFFATTTPAVRRSVYGPALRSLDRFLDDAVSAARSAGTQFRDEDGHWELSIDVPGVTREQLTIAIEAVADEVKVLGAARAVVDLATAVDSGA